MSGQTLHTKAYYCGISAGNTSGIDACPRQSPGAGVPVNYFANGANDISNWHNPIMGVDTQGRG